MQLLGLEPKKTIYLMGVKKMSKETLTLIDSILQGGSSVRVPKMSGKEFGLFIDGLRAARLAKAK